MSVAGDYTVTVSYTERGTTETTTYTLTVNKIYETIFAGKRSVGWVPGESGQLPYIGGEGEVNDVGITERNTQEIRITWSWNAFGGYHWNGPAGNVAWNEPVPYSGYWFFGNEIKYIYEYSRFSWKITSWYSNWLLTHKATGGNWDDSGSSTHEKCIDEFTLDLSATTVGAITPILGNSNAEGNANKASCQASGVCLVFNTNTGKFELHGTGGAGMHKDYRIYPLSTKAKWYEKYSEPMVTNLGITIWKIEIKR